MKHASRAAIVGSGIAGLATALRLRHKGYDVTVFEANSYHGGKMHATWQDGYRFDLGPSLFTLPHLVDELFELFGKNPRDYFNYLKKDTVCHYFWEDGTRFQVPSEKEAFIDACSKTFGIAPSEIRSYLNRNALKYQKTAPLFLESSLHKVKTYLKPETLEAVKHLFSFDLMETLHATNKRLVKHPKLIQLFNRYATYNGSSPYKTPGIMSLIPHLEMDLGTFFPVGGMHAIPDSLVALGTEMGIHFRYNSPVTRIRTQGNKVNGITVNGEDLPFDVVVSNMDIYPTYEKLLPDTKTPEQVLKQERSSSALIFYWGMKGSFPELDLHNIFFSEDYKEEFRHLFETHTLYHDPTVYVHVSSKQETADAPENCESWFVMINAPARYEQDWENFREQSRRAILSKLSRILKQDVESFIETEFVLDPPGIETATGSHRGSLYGTSSNSRLAAFLRHPNFHRKIPNLYFCGGSVHPGGGVPLCLLSARITADLID